MHRVLCLCVHAYGAHLVYGMVLKVPYFSASVSSMLIIPMLLLKIFAKPYEFGILMCSVLFL